MGETVAKSVTSPPAVPSSSRVLPCNASDDAPKAPSQAALKRASTKSMTNDATAGVVTADTPDPYAGRVKINYVSVLVALVTYGLLLTDIPRTGTKTINTMRTIGNGYYMYLGAFAYPMLTYRRDLNTGQVTATKGETNVNAARVWSYKFDTTSTTIRLAARHLNASTHSWLPCLQYERSDGCMQNDMMPLGEIFAILDGVVTALSDDTQIRPPGIPMVANASEQRTRLVETYKVRRTDLLYEYIIVPLLDRLVMYTCKLSYFRTITASDFHICANPQDRPFQCDVGIYADFRVMASPTSSASVSAGFPWLRIHERARAMIASYANHTGNLTYDMAVLDSYVHPTAYTGGIVSAGTVQFDNVLLLRVRECDRASCETVYLEDYRFEGGGVISDFVDWGNLVSVIRIVAQSYFYFRLVGLVWACHMSATPQYRSVRRTAWLALSEAPSHVVSYGPAFPVLLYALAHCMDANITNVMVIVRSIKLQGETLKSPREVFLIICLLMRRQWLLSAMSWMWVQLQTMWAGWTRRDGLLSVRGHIFGVLASMSVALGYRSASYRFAEILETRPGNPHPGALLASLHDFDPMGQRHSGVWSDLISLLLCAVVYGIFMFLVQMCVYVFTKHHASRDVQRGLLYAFCESTTDLPSTCGRLWGVSGFVCAWSGDIVLTAARVEKYNVDEAGEAAKKRIILLNVVMLSDPLVLVALYFGLNRSKVYKHRDPATCATFWSMEKDEPLGKKAAAKLECVGWEYADALPFYELVRCN